jgi:hypothetical protein
LGLARLASGVNATTESGDEAEKAGWSGRAGGWARAAELAEPERASHSGEAVLSLESGMFWSPHAGWKVVWFFRGWDLAAAGVALSLGRVPLE